MRDGGWWRSGFKIPAFAGMTGGRCGNDGREAALWAAWAPAFAGDSAGARDSGLSGFSCKLGGGWRNGGGDSGRTARMTEGRPE